MRRISFIASVAALTFACGGPDFSTDNPSAGGTSGLGGASSAGKGGAENRGGSKHGGAGSSGTSGGSGSGTTGGSAGSGTTSGGTGSGATSGNTGSGGDAGSGATGGSAGSGATGGDAGSGTTGGSAGSGGSGGMQTGADPECTQASDCSLYGDCCSCLALAKDELPLLCADVVCIQNECEAHGISNDAVRCIAGRCVLAQSCNDKGVSCGTTPPDCPVGTVPVVKEGCWANFCAPATECEEVGDCNECPSGSRCVVLSDENSLHCASVPAECQPDSGCSCMASSVCLPPLSSCSELAGGDASALVCQAP